MSKRRFIISFVAFVVCIVCIGWQYADMQKEKTSDSSVKQKHKLSFLSVREGKIVDENGKAIMLRGLHYDCFYVFRKNIYDKIKANNEDPDETNIVLSRYYFTENDIKKIKELYATVVRVGIRLWEIEKSPYSYSEKSLKHLDETIKKWGENGVYVILDLHAAGQNRLNHNKEYGNILWDNKDHHDRVIALWGTLATRYKDNPYIAGYDLINEPQAPSKEILYEFYKKVIKGIRKNDKKHILIIEQNLHDRNKIGFGGEYDDNNIVLSRHFYMPHKFTHQGMGGRPKGYKYPSKYNNTYFDKNKIDSFFSELIAENKRKRPIFIGEFSANSWHGEKYAIQWIRDVLDVLNSKGIHYTYFQYKFIMPNSFAYWSPTQKTNKKLMALVRILGRKKLNSLSEENKKLLLTENFEAPPDIGIVLKTGFSK